MKNDSVLKRLAVIVQIYFFQTDFEDPFWRPVSVLQIMQAFTKNINSHNTSLQSSRYYSIMSNSKDYPIVMHHYRWCGLKPGNKA